MVHIDKKSFKIIGNKFIQSEISIYAGQTAFFLILSFFPFMLFFFSLLHLTPFTEADIFAWAETIIPSAFWDIIQSIIHDIYRGSTGRISVTIILALWLSSKSLFCMQNGLDSMYGYEDRKNAVFRRLLSILYSVIFAVMLIAFLTLMVFGKIISTFFFPNIYAFAQLIHYRYFLAVPILFLFFWITYTFLPNGLAKLRRQIPGALFASVGWIVFSLLFAVYVDKFCRYDSIYGNLTTIALIMLWLYGCMYMIFLGGLINSIWMNRPLHIKRKEIKAVIFDLDGTLIDTEKYYMKAWPEAMAKFGYTITMEEALSLRSLGRPYAPERLKEISGDPDFDYTKVREYRKELMENYLAENGIELKPFAKEILAGLREKGYVVALATANDYERAERYLKKIDLFDSFDQILCATMVEKGKPSPDLYQYAAKSLGLDPNECLAVEDSPNGVTSAATAGIPTVMIPDLTKPDRALKRLIYKTYPNLKKFYRRLFD